jgi:hypothetical protein
VRAINTSKGAAACVQTASIAATSICSMMHAAVHGIDRDQRVCFIPRSPHPLHCPSSPYSKNAGAEFVSKIDLAMQYTMYTQLQCVHD